MAEIANSLCDYKKVLSFSVEQILQNKSYL